VSSYSPDSYINNLGISRINTIIKKTDPIVGDAISDLSTIINKHTPYYGGIYAGYKEDTGVLV